MKSNIFTSQHSMYIEIQESKLDISTVTENPAFPVTSAACKSIIFKLDSITEIDASGLSWFLGYIDQLKQHGTKTYVTGICKVTQVLEYLGLENLIKLEQDRIKLSAM